MCEALCIQNTIYKLNQQRAQVGKECILLNLEQSKERNSVFYCFVKEECKDDLNTR